MRKFKVFLVFKGSGFLCSSIKVFLLSFYLAISYAMRIGLNLLRGEAVVMHLLREPLRALASVSLVFDEPSGESC